LKKFAPPLALFASYEMHFVCILHQKRHTGTLTKNSPVLFCLDLLSIKLQSYHTLQLPSGMKATQDAASASFPSGFPRMLPLMPKTEQRTIHSHAAGADRDECGTRCCLSLTKNSPFLFCLDL
jgi:hypothetical protein